MATKTRIKLAADAATEIAVGSEWELFFPWSLAAPPAAVVFSVIGVYTTVKEDKMRRKCSIRRFGMYTL